VPLARIATRKVPVLVGRGEALVAAMAPAALQRDAAPAHAQARAADAPGAPDVPPAIRLGPRTPLELVRQAQHLERMGSRAAAMATLERVVRLVRRPAPLYNKLGLLALQSPRDPERAVEYLRRAVELDPDSSTFVQNLQRALVELRPLHTVAAGAH
jgi:tetratricopeptide (TPR) repeat protein